MPNAKYLAIQEECYRLVFEDERARLARVKELKKRFDPIGQCEVACGFVAWGTRDHRIIPLPFMRVSHLRNAYQFQYRNAAALYAMHQNGRLTDEEKEQFIRRVLYMNGIKAELKRRKLPVPPENKEFGKLYVQFHDTLYPDRYYDDYDTWHPGHPDNYGDS
jgi:hypothetical protein